MPDNIPWYLHKAEGSLFGWLWLEGLPFSDSDLYNRLKAENVIVVPGAHSFTAANLLLITGSVFV